MIYFLFSFNLPGLYQALATTSSAVYYRACSRMEELIGLEGVSRRFRRVHRLSCSDRDSAVERAERARAKYGADTGAGERLRPPGVGYGGN